MSKLYFLLFILLQALGVSYGQQTSELFSLRVGYSTTNIGFKEAFVPSFQFFGRTIKLNRTFAGDGPEFGVSKNINDNLFIDLNISTFAAQGNQLRVGNYQTFYSLKGFQIPLTANYLLRDASKKLRINAGAGFQYLNGHLQQFESISTNSGEVVNQLTDINVSEVQFALRPGVQLRLVPNLFASFIVRASISTNGRYSDQPCLSLRYAFQKNKVKQ